MIEIKINRMHVQFEALFFFSATFWFKTIFFISFENFQTLSNKNGSIIKMITGGPILPSSFQKNVCDIGKFGDNGTFDDMGKKKFFVQKVSNK
jgi:hypothetical protein